MEEELSMLKKSLISLVVSSPTTMTVSRLLKDYRSMVGGVLPLAKYGYREPVLFLRERCTDIFVVEGPSWDPILTPKVTKNLAHIDQMVQKQKVQSTGKHKGKRRSILQPNSPVEAKPVTRSNPPNRFDSPSKYEPQNRHIQSNGYNNKTNNYDASNKYEKKPLNSEFKTPSKPQNQVQTKSKEDMNKENEYNSKHIDISNGNKTSQDASSKSTFHNDEIENVTDSVERCPMSALSKFYKKRLPQYNSDMDFPSPDLEQTSKSSAESAGQSSLSSGSKQVLLEELKAEIVALIASSPGGVWCTDLIKLYKETYGRELKFSRFGHTRLISLVYSIEDQVAVSRPAPDSDWLLQDRNSVGAGAGTGAGAGGAPRRVTRHVPARAPPTDNDDALPGVDFDKDVFPPDCLHYLDCVPGAALEEAGPGATLEVLLGEVYSPSHFWMLRVGDQHNQAMEHIMDQMNDYYNGSGSGRVLARGAVRVGQYCAALFDGDWHRALIVCIVDSDTVKVRHVDYGTVDSVPARSLRPLLRQWGQLPAQAIRARLAGARPAAAGWRWPRAACAAFLQRVQERRLYAHVLRRDLADDILETFLIDTAGERDVCLTRELIRAGHADARHDSALRSEDCYLYPRFEALESGAAPNYADICRMLADGIALEYVDAYRRHVPGPWARPPAPAPLPPPPDLPSPSPEPQPSHSPQSPQQLELSHPMQSPRPSYPSQPPQSLELSPPTQSPRPSHPMQPPRPWYLSPPSHPPLSPYSLEFSPKTQPPRPSQPTETPRPSYLSQPSHPPQSPHSLEFSPQTQPPRPSQPTEPPRPSYLSQPSYPPQTPHSLEFSPQTQPPRPSQPTEPPRPSYLSQPSHPPQTPHSLEFSLQTQPPQPPQPTQPPRPSYPSQPLRPPQPSHPPQPSQLPQPSHPPLFSQPPQPLQLPQFSHPPPPQAWSYAGGACVQPPGMPAGVAGDAGDAGGSLEVRLSAAEWAVLSRLRGADPAAAHWYLLTSACRSLMPPPPGL